MITDAVINSNWLRKSVTPEVELLLKTLPGVRYATLFVAQYYDDQAMDEVHGKVIFSKNPIPDDISLYNEKYERAPYFYTHQKAEARKTEIKTFEKVGLGYLSADVPYEMIEHLQPYCKDDGDQCSDFEKNYAPFHKWSILDGGAVLTEDVSKVIRPWLVGAVREEDDY